MDNSKPEVKQFVYFYFNRNEPEKVKRVVPAHVQYWKTSQLKNYMGGPFRDQTGGLITFAALTLQEATEIIQKDPFVVEDLLAENWIKEWMPE